MSTPDPDNWNGDYDDCWSGLSNQVQGADVDIHTKALRWEAWPAQHPRAMAPKAISLLPAMQSYSLKRLMTWSREVTQRLIVAADILVVRFDTMPRVRNGKAFCDILLSSNISWLCFQCCYYCNGCYCIYMDGWLLFRDPL